MLDRYQMKKAHGEKKRPPCLWNQAPAPVLKSQSMDENELLGKLKSKGHKVGTPYVRHDGKMMWVVDEVGMFRLEAVELANGRTTVEEILRRKRPDT